MSESRDLMEALVKASHADVPLHQVISLVESAYGGEFIDWKFREGAPVPFLPSLRDRDN